MKRILLAVLAGGLLLASMLLVAPTATAQVGQPIPACDTARAAYDEQITKVTNRARELGWTDEDVTRIQGLAEKAQSDGTITEDEQQTILNDPAVQRIRTQLNLDDLLQLRELGSRANALLRCQQDNPNNTQSSTSTVTAPPSAVTLPASPSASTSRSASTATSTSSSAATSTNRTSSATSSTVVTDKDGNPVEVQVRVVPNAAPETGDGSTAP